MLEDGVAHVMRLFLAHATGQPQGSAAADEGSEQPQDQHLDAMRRLVEVECDEVALDRE